MSRVDLLETMIWTRHQMGHREVWRKRKRIPGWLVEWFKAWFGRGPWQELPTAAEMDAVHAYLANKWGVPAPPPWSQGEDEG